MMRPAVVLVPALALLSWPAAAQERPKVMAPAPPGESSPIATGGGPPSITVVDGVKDGKLLVRKTMYTAIPEPYTVQETVPVDVEGKTVNKTVNRQKTRLRFVSQTQVDSHPLSDVQVFDAEARPVARERIPGLFTGPRMVLATTRGMPVDPAFLKLVRPGTYLVVIPLPAPVTLPGTGPVPQPMRPTAPTAAPKPAAPPAAATPPAAPAPG